jgi:hypothetical protein
MKKEKTAEKIMIEESIKVEKELTEKKLREEQ